MFAPLDAARLRRAIVEARRLEVEAAAIAVADGQLYDARVRAHGEFHARLLRIADDFGGLRQGEFGSRFSTQASSLVLGRPEDAALGVELYMCVKTSVVRLGMNEGVAAVVREFTQFGTRVDKECLEYVLHAEAGSSELTFSNGSLKRDCGPDGQLLPERRAAGGGGMRLADFLAHPHSRAAELEEAHVLALRLYSTAAYQSLNSPLRDTERFLNREPHPLPITVAFIGEAIRRLRVVDAQSENRNQPLELYRGLRDMRVTDEIMVQGGTELAPMSTTTSLEVAVRYSVSPNSVLLRLHTRSFMERGADLSFLSCFPAESEILFPPLTFLRFTGEAQTIAIDESTLTVVDAAPSM